MSSFNYVASICPGPDQGGCSAQKLQKTTIKKNLSSRGGGGGGHLSTMSTHSTYAADLTVEQTLILQSLLICTYAIYSIQKDLETHHTLHRHFYL